MQHKKINDQKNESSKISIAAYRDHSDNDNSAPPDINSNIVIFGDSILKGVHNPNSFEYST